MMKVEWNKVTWYSKLVALALFVALPFIGFYYGARFGVAAQSVRDFNAAQSAAGTDYYHQPATWQTESAFPEYFSIAYPLDFNIDDQAALPSPAWRLNAPEGDAGTLFFTLTVPRAFEPQTNFADAKLTVGESSRGASVASCLATDQSGGPNAVPTSTAVIDGVPFTVFHSNDAGAGNFYETTSYRAIHGGACWAIEYTIHSANIGNYPPEYQLKPFDRAKAADVLDRIARTFRFL